MHGGRKMRKAMRASLSHFAGAVRQKTLAPKGLAYTTLFARQDTRGRRKRL